MGRAWSHHISPGWAELWYRQITIRLWEYMLESPGGKTVWFGVLKEKLLATFFSRGWKEKLLLPGPRGHLINRKFHEKM